MRNVKNLLTSLVPTFRRVKPRMPPPGSAPGTLRGASDLPPPVVRRYCYHDDHFETAEVDLADIDRALTPVPGGVVWVDLQGLGDVEAVERVGSILGLHPLTLEDVVHVHQRPKLEEFDDYLFVVLRAVHSVDDRSINNEQISFVIKEGLLVTFQERLGDGFDPVRRRLRERQGFTNRGGADYLAYTLIDAVIDNYFPVLEIYGDTMDQLEERVRNNPTPEVSAFVHQMRRELRLFRRAIFPLRDVTSALARSANPFLGETVRPAFRDCNDHVVQVADFVEGSRERASELADLYLVMVGERTNQVMKVLTIIATIFIPLTFLCGLYGMNFDTAVSPYNMPELKWRYGYPVFLGVMIVVAAAMVLFFKRKGWIGSAGSPSSRSSETDTP